MKTLKLVGEYNKTYIYKHTKTDAVYVSCDYNAQSGDDDAITCLVAHEGESLEDFIAALRAATRDPKEAAIAAAQEYVKVHLTASHAKRYSEEGERLVKALELLE